MSDKTPISNFLNGLTNKVRETEQKFNKPKKNWDSESQSHSSKSFKDFDVESSLNKAEEKLGVFSSTVSTKFSEAVSRLNEKVNTDEQGEPEKTRNTAFSDAMGGLDNESEKNSKSVEEEVESLMRTTPSTGFNHEAANHQNTKGKNYSEALSDLGNKWNKHVANERNAEKFDNLLNSLNVQLHALTEKANSKINSVSMNNLSDSSETVHYYRGDNISSGSEFISILDTHATREGSSFGVIVDSDNENNSLFLALMAAKNKGYEFLNIDLTNLLDNDLSNQKVRRSFSKVRDFLKEDNDDYLITVDVRHSSAEVINAFVNSLYSIDSFEGYEEKNKKVLILVDDLDQLVLDEVKGFAEIYPSSVVFQY